jgi:hypothetical protein
MASPATDMGSQMPQQGRPLLPPQRNAFVQQQRQQTRNMPQPNPSQSFQPSTQPNQAMQDSYYPPSFQKHYSQLGKLTPFFPLPLFVELCSS